MSTDYNNITIRHADLSDINEIANMQITAWEDDFRCEPIFPLLKNFFYGELKRRWNKKLEENNHILVVIRENTIIGFLIYTIDHLSLSSKKKIRAANLKNIYIIPSMRRNGLGTLLCEAFFDEVKKSGIEKVITWSLKNHQRAKNFYEALGFMLSPKERLDILNGNETLIEVLYQISV